MCIRIESTPIKKITAAPLCRWVYHHLSIISLTSFWYCIINLFSFDRSIGLSSVLPVLCVVVVVLFEYIQAKTVSRASQVKNFNRPIILSAHVRTQFALRMKGILRFLCLAMIDVFLVCVHSILAMMKEMILRFFY